MKPERMVTLVVALLACVTADTLVWNEPIGHTPQPRFQHTATRFGNELFVFAGDKSSASLKSDLHVLNLVTNKWRKPEVSGNIPQSLNGHSAFAWQDQMIVLFGNNGHINTNRLYSLDTETFAWTRIVTHGRIPTPRSYQSVAFVDEQLFVFGGYDGRAYLNDLHVWQVFDHKTNTTGDWRKLEQKGIVPEIRAGAASALHGRKMYMFGGFEVSIYKNDFFVLDLDKLSWSRVWLNHGSCEMPTSRAMATLTLVGTRLMLFGGVFCSSDGNCTHLNDVHSFDLSEGMMRAIDHQSVEPPARYGHSATLIGTKVVVFGGAAWPMLYNDLFEFDIYDYKWTLPAGYPPYARKQHTLDVLTLDGRSHLAVFGGKHGSGSFSNHMHLFDIEKAQWSHPDNVGPVPAVGHHATAVRDNTTIVVFGGYDGVQSFNDVYFADASTGDRIKWSKSLADGVAPHPCHGHAVVSTSDRWLLFGGVDCQGQQCVFFNTIHALPKDSLTWAPVEIIGNSPQPRASHSWTTLADKQHYMFGGIGPQFNVYGDLMLYDQDMMTWAVVNTVGARPSPRFGHVAYEYMGKLVVFGGSSCTSLTQCDYFNDVLMFNPGRVTWTTLEVRRDAPSPRAASAGVRLGRVLYLHGGATKDKIFGDLLTMESDFTVPNNTIVYGAGVTEGVAGRNVKFFVQTVDSFFGNRTVGGDSVVVTVTPSTRLAIAKLQGVPIAVSVEDGGQGMYLVQYSTNVTDHYTVVVRVNGEVATTFETSIIADLPDPINSPISGAGMGRCMAGLECTFHVELYDQYRNKLQRPAPVDVHFEGPYPVHKTIDDSIPGTPTIRYTPTKSGVYKVTVRIRLQDLFQSPFNVTVVPGKPSPKHSRVEGDALHTVMAGANARLTLFLLDEFDNDVGAGGFNVTVAVGGPESLFGTVNDLGNGKFILEYVAAKIGAHQLSVRLNDIDVEGSPFAVDVTNAVVSAANSFAYGAGIRYSVAGYRSYFTIQTADDYGNNMTHGGAILNVVFAGPKDVTENCTVVDLHDGRYTVSYYTTLAGDFILSATIRSPTMGFQSIHLSPFLGSVVASGADPVHSYVYAKSPDQPLGKTMFRVVMGVHNYFYIQAVDRYGNKKTTGGDKFSAEIDGPVTHDVFITDNTDGTYIGTYVAPSQGSYYLKIFYGNVPVNNTPIAVRARVNFDVCLNGCNDRGECVNNECQCYSGYAGRDCSIETVKCPGNCMGNGACINNTCLCYPGFSGPACADVVKACPNDCSNHGECILGNCKCQEGFGGVDCSDNSGMCPDACMGNGECVGGACMCYPGFSGDNCSVRKVFCPLGCAAHGTCLNTGACLCHAGWGGLDCGQYLLQDSKAPAAMQPSGLPNKLSRK